MSNAHWLESSIIPSKIENSYNETLTKLEEKSVGCLLGGAIGDAFGSQIKPEDNYEKMSKYPIKELKKTTSSGALWNDSTSISLALSASLIIRQKFESYDQLSRYKRWWRHGYLAPNGRITVISRSMRESLERFNGRQSELSRKLNYRDIDEMDRYINGEQVTHAKFDYQCGSLLYLDNSPLCRVAPIALYFYSRNQSPSIIISYVALSTQQTHTDNRCIDACRYLCAIFLSILDGSTKNAVLYGNFADKCYRQGWFGSGRLHYLVEKIARGSFKKYDGYNEGIRSTHNDILASLEAILWSLWNDNDGYQQGIINIVQLGDDASTVASVYGQLAGALYGIENIPQKWIENIYAAKFIESIAREIVNKPNSNKKIENINSDQNLKIEHNVQDQQIQQKESLWVKLFGKPRSTKTDIDQRPFNFGQEQNDG